MDHLTPHAPTQSVQLTYPTVEVVIRNGQPIWQVCGAGLCVEEKSGSRAMDAFRALCCSRGITPPTGAAPPYRGPSEVDEPGL